jgi:hypothetical protein
MESFRERLAILLIDKVVIAGIAFLRWHLYTKRKEVEAVLRKKLESVEEEKRSLEREKRRSELSEKINFVSEKLQNFYWPIALHLKKGDAVWEKIPALSNSDASLPKEMGNIIEKEFLIPNHEKAVTLIESNFALVAEDEELVKLMIAYIRHVAVYRALRISDLRLNPIDMGEPFPAEMVGALETRMAECIDELSRLKELRFNLSSRENAYPRSAAKSHPSSARDDSAARRE